MGNRTMIRLKVRIDGTDYVVSNEAEYSIVATYAADLYDWHAASDPDNQDLLDMILASEQAIIGHFTEFGEARRHMLGALLVVNIMEHEFKCQRAEDFSVLEDYAQDISVWLSGGSWYDRLTARTALADMLENQRNLIDHFLPNLFNQE